MHHQVQQAHHDKDAAEGHHNRRAGGRIELHAQVATGHRNERTHGPADGEAGTDAISKKHGADAGYDQIAKHKKDARDGHRRRHHKAERSVKKKIPETHAKAEAFRFFVVHGNKQKLLAEDVVKNSHQRVENGGLAHFRPGHGQNVADQHVFEVLGFASGLAHEQDGHGGSHGVSDADESLLRDVAAAGTRESEDWGTQQREPETDPIRAAAVGIHTHHDGDCRSERGDLRESQIHENDTTLDDVHAEIRVNAGENQAGYKGR